MFFSYERGSRGIEVRKSVEERMLGEEVASTVFTLFNNRLLFVEKTYLEGAIDSILQRLPRTREKYKVFYGLGIGTLNLTEIIPPLLDRYIKGRYELTIATPQGSYTYGRVNKKDVVYIYETLIPVPDEKVGKLTLLISG